MNKNKHQTERDQTASGVTDINRMAQGNKFFGMWYTVRENSLERTSITNERQIRRQAHIHSQRGETC